MEEDDIVRIRNIDSVRAINQRTAKRVVSVSIFAGLLGGLVFAGLTYLFTGSSQTWLVYACIIIFTCLGAYEAIKWHRHYRSIDMQLDALELRVKEGETIFASQFKFYSQR